MGQIPLNFLSPLTPKLLIGCEKFVSVKMVRTYSNCMQSSVVIRRRRAAGDGKIPSFLSDCLSVMLGPECELHSF